MKHFTKCDGSVWAFELDGAQDYLITEDMVQISEVELAELRASKINPKDAIRAKIAKIESSITPRRMREALLTNDRSFIEKADAEIVVLRSQL